MSLFRETPTPRADAPRPVKIAWLRDMLRVTAQIGAAEYLLGHDRSAWLDEFSDAAIGFGMRRCRLSYEDVALAAKLEWKAGLDRARKFHADLRRRLWPLAKMGAAPAQIRAEANAVNMQHGVVLATQLLDQEARKIWAAAAPQGRRGRGGRRRIAA